MVSIMDIITSVDGSLDQSTPNMAHQRGITAVGPKKERIIEVLKGKLDDYYFYAATITIDRKVKNASKRLVYKLPAWEQRSFVRKWMIDNLMDTVYFGVFEYTEVGVIHCHMMIAHPTIHIVNSLVRESIRDAMMALGKIQYICSMSKPDKYIDYILKEYDERIDMLQYSSHFLF